MTQEAMEARRAYKRKWASENREKVRAQQERYWNKKAAQEEAGNPEPQPAKLEDVYARQTYWIRKEYIQKVKDLAYTERRSVRQMLDKLLKIAFDQIDQEYQTNGKLLERYMGDKEL